MERKIRVLLFKPGLDGHWRGIITVSKALSEAGMEVVFAGFHSLEGIVETALQEDVDVIGFSVHSGAHLEWARAVVDALKEKNYRDDFLLLIGGVFPQQDYEVLKEIGIDGVFRPGTHTSDIVEFIHSSLASKRHDK